MLLVPATVASYLLYETRGYTILDIYLQRLKLWDKFYAPVSGGKKKPLTLTITFKP